MTMISQKIQKKSFLSVAVMAASFFPTVVFSLEVTPPKIEETIVTISRIEQPLGDVIGSVSQFTAEDIKRIQPYDLNDMFEMQPGVDVLRSGGRGAVSSIQVRGSSSGQTLMLVNGVRISSATLGTARYALVPSELVGHVELLRGSASALYGSDAMAGVVNIKTAATINKESGVNVGVEYGSHNYHRAAIAGNVDGGQLDLAVAAVRESSDGIDSIKHSFIGENIADKDGYERMGGALDLSYRPDKQSMIALFSFANSGESDFDKLPSIFSPDDYKLLPYSESSLVVHHLTAAREVNDMYSTNLNIGYSADESEDKENNPEVNSVSSVFKTVNKTMSWLNDIRFLGQTVTLGVERHLAEVESTSDYNENRRKTDGVFAQFNGGFGAFSYSLGLREDNIERVASPTTPSAGISLDFLSAHRIYARYAEGFKAPTFNDLYFPWGGNPELKPEESESSEFGYRLNLNAITFQASIYDKNIENLIQWAPDEEGAWSPMNVGKASMQGVELAVAIPVGALGSFDVAADYLNAVDATSQSEEKTLDYRAKKTLRIEWLKAFSDFEFGVQAKMQSERKVPVSIAVSGYSPGYGIANATFSYQLTNEIRLQAKLNNMFDKEYTLNPSYNEDGRNWVAGVKATF